MNDEEHGSWKGIRVRDKDGRMGTIARDLNGPWHRYLDIVFDDGSKHELKLNNSTKNPHDPLGIEWEYNPGKWGLISI